MIGRELRYLLLQNIIGISGCAALIFSVISPGWYRGKGLWEPLLTPSAQNGSRLHTLSSALGTEHVFGVIASLMAIMAICISLLFIFCWNPDTDSKSKMNPGRILHPGKLLIVILMPTALLYLITWSLFTNRHMEQIKNDITQFGSAYWIGMCSWFTLLIILPIVYLMEQCSLTDYEAPI
ncbi:uncharacterized protein si:ch211-256a21.4 isoform X1 [Scyliorhinus canicula]|uniref:uncharacterized protein si:ch211-256a21.4 isoform X1 n=1 Tax=Scyliorhinus canicula TaxID=7830 RepID=UPI0018F3BF0C|nr:uncharacterized protein si:ch211-256a21.4 isoform X1 [Scyliorhinus canicula]